MPKLYAEHAGKAAAVMAALLRWFTATDPLVASKELNKKMRARDFAAETADRMAARELTFLAAKLKKQPVGSGMYKVVQKDIANLHAKQTVSGNTNMLMHKLFYSADSVIHTIVATTEAQQMSDICASVRVADGDVLKKSVAVARQLNHADKIMDALDNILSVNDDDDDDDDDDDSGGNVIKHAALTSAAPAPPTHPVMVGTARRSLPLH